ncbi:MAG: lysophospholipid acyltransferase family protein, partial [Burkholderiales bacterium]
ATGFSIVIFPEGTRIPPGMRGKYRPGGARLAVQTGTPVLSVAHNAGLCWPRNAFFKRPGLITVSIGAPIDPAGMDAEVLATQVEHWIESEMPRLADYPSPAP